MKRFYFSVSLVRVFLFQLMRKKVQKDVCDELNQFKTGRREIALENIQEEGFCVCVDKLKLQLDLMRKALP